MFSRLIDTRDLTDNYYVSNLRSQSNWLLISNWKWLGSCGAIVHPKTISIVTGLSDPCCFYLSLKHETNQKYFGCFWCRQLKSKFIWLNDWTSFSVLCKMIFQWSTDIWYALYFNISIFIANRYAHLGPNQTSMMGFH